MIKPKSQNPTNCFFLFLSELRVSTLLIILSLFLLCTSSYCIKKSTFTLLLWLASHFTENLEQLRTHLPYFYFTFSVLWSSPVEQLIKSEVLIMTTYHLLQWLSQYTLRVFGKISFSFSAKPKFNRQNDKNKRNGHKFFMINQNR